MDIKIFHPIETMRHSAKNKKKTRRRVFVPFYMVPLRKRRCRRVQKVLELKVRQRLHG